jgi:glycosyltransferase involved in cell wall biosynthesis
MNITIITSQLGGTGGALNCIMISNKLISEGHRVKIFSEQGSAESIRQMIRAEVIATREAPDKIDSDIGIAFNLNKVTKKLLYSIQGKKFARLGIIVPEYEDVIRDKEVVKITTTTYEKSYVDLMEGRNVVAIPGPADVSNFYREPSIPRNNNLILCYVKKSSWVGIVAINLAQDSNKNLIFASLGGDGLDVSPVKSRYPVIILGCPAEFRSFMRYCYNVASVFVDTNSNGPWGWSCTVSEAMLCKCPVVATDSPVFNDIIISDETALTAPCNEENELPTQDWKTRPSSEKIADSILKLYDNPKLALRLTNNAYEVVRKFDINYWYSEFMKLV